MAEHDEVLDDVVDLAYAARYLHISPRNAYRLATRGELPGAFKVGRSWRVRRDTLEALGMPDDKG